MKHFEFGLDNLDGDDAAPHPAEPVTARGLATRDARRALTPHFHYPPALPMDVDSALSRDVATAHDPFSDHAEEFRALRSDLLATLARAGRRALAVLSQDPHDGKSYIAANLAASFAQLGGRTLLVDGNMRAPGLGQLLSAGSAAGLSDLLAGDGDEAEAIVPVAGVDGLHFLPAGPWLGDPVRLLHGPRLHLLMQRLLGEYDHVLVDTPANADGPDGRLLAVAAGAALLVARRGQTRVAPVRRLLGQLGNSPALVAGVVMNQH